MSSIQGFITLDETVREYLLVSGKHLNEYAKCLLHAKRGLQELNWDISGMIRSVTLPIEAGNIVRYPDDYVQYVQLSVCKNGTKVTLGLNPKMCENNYNSCGQIIATVGGNLEPSGYATQTGVVADTGLPWLGNGVASAAFSQTLGIGGGYSSIGYYKPDPQRRVFQLSERFTGTELILDYVTNGYSAQGTTVDGKNLIHIFMREAISFYIAWSECCLVKSRLSEAREFRRQYIRAKEQAFRRLKPLRLREVINACRNSFMRGVKF
jgi:hypothetical protein